MFWDTEGKGSVTHTTICIGGGEMIHAPKPNDKVKKATYLNNSYWQPKFISAKRYWS